MPLLKALRALAFALICMLAALLLLTALTPGLAERRVTRALQALPDHDYTVEILALKNQGRISEALDWACYVTNNPALPNQAAATNLVATLEKEQTSVWHQADRAAKGFIVGSGTSVEELGGAIASDMMVYGDCRDLVLQGYYRLTGHETDAVVAALAGIGLLTELVDALDWAPAVLKAFRKANAMSQRFGEWLTAACRRSAKARKLEPSLPRLFKDLKQLHARLGLARSAAVFKHADQADDVAALAKLVDTHPGEVYRFLETAGNGSLPLLRHVADEPRGFARIAVATRKGLPGINALRKGGELRHVTLFVRYGERILRTFRLQRPQQFLQAFAMRSSAARKTMWAAAAALLCIAAWQTWSVFRRQPHRYAVA